MAAAPAASTPMTRARPARRPRARRRRPTMRPPPPTGTSTTLGVGHFFGQLEADRPLAGYHERVVERRHVIGAPLGGVARAAAMALSTGAGFEADLGAVAAGGIDLGQRCPGRHEDGGAQAAERSGQGHALGVVAGRGGHYFLRRPPPEAREAIRLKAPRILNEPVRWKCSGLT